MRPESETFADAKQKLARNLRVLRLERGLSQEQLADLAGCDRTYVGMLERKLANPSLAMLSAIADTLGVDISQMLR